MIDGHGDDVYLYDGLIKYNFSSNIYLRADLAPLEQHLRKTISCVRNYPEPSPVSLERVISEKAGISCDNVMVTSGAIEAIYMIAERYGKAFKGRNIVNVISQPTFSEYADACILYGGKVSHDDIGEPSVWWLCNPCNPTGKVVAKEKILQTIDSKPEDLFVIDQSYEDYTTEEMLSDVEIVSRKNVLLIHSMTKRYCIPGLRVGYVTSCNEIIADLRRFRRPWSVNSLALEAGKWLVANAFCPVCDKREYLAEAQWLYKALQSVEGINVFPTSTNFMLARLENHTAASLKRFLVGHYGILIRDASNFSGLDESFFRVAAQGHDENMMLVKAIEKYLQLDE
ncbi:MAG: aminotransferase class I/II-fold pyridoxal phosphate-dependent enzyme [Prevotella sp.]